MSLQRIIYGFLKAQIEFGAYRFQDPLPSIEEMGRWFSVSLDTVYAAYLRLKQEGLITLTKKAGATVTVQYDAGDIEGHVQAYFSQRRDAATDLCGALGPVFNHAQRLALQGATAQQLEGLERLCASREVHPAHLLIRHVYLVYSLLNNSLLLRLIWQMFMFFHATFFSLPQYTDYFSYGEDAIPSMIELCRDKDWSGLGSAVEGYQSSLSAAIGRFYDERIAAETSGKPVAFHWNFYEKPSQRRYSLAMELLADIRRGVYPEGSYLPAPARIAELKQVSTITVRRTLALLNQLGATRTFNGIGTQVQDIESSAEHCDFSSAVLQKRLLDFAESLHLLVLTCRDCAKLTLDSLDQPAIGQWKERLLLLRQIKRYEGVGFTSLEFISQFAPVQAIRDVYTQLLQLLLWGYPLRGMRGPQEEVNREFFPYIDSLLGSLDRRDAESFAAELERVLCYELGFVVSHLEALGIHPAFRLVEPELAGK